METDLAGAYTKTSTSDSLSSFSDQSIEEHSNSSFVELIPLDSVINYLVNPRAFIYQNSKGINQSCTVYFTENLNALHLILNEKETKKVFIPDIMDIAPAPYHMNKKYIENIYFINIRTRDNLFVLGSKNSFDRDYWISCSAVLLKHARECFGSFGFRKYCDNVIKNKENQDHIVKIRDKQYHEWLKLKNFERELKMCEKEAIASLVDEMISTVQVMDQQKSLKKYKKNLRVLNGEKFLLKQSQGNLIKSIQQKDKEIKVLTESLTSIKNHLMTLNSNFNTISPWKLIIPFLSFSDLLVLRSVSKVHMRSAYYYLKNKFNWKKLVHSTLHPRKISWRMYFKNFYDIEIACMGQEVTPDVIEDIKKDVNRGLPDHFEEVEEVLLGVCSLIPNVGYCQGMQQVAHFLLGYFRDSNEVLGILLNLLRPPFYLGDLWKIGFTRLKLGIFQLKYLLKLKLPYITNHFKKIGVKLDIIVTPWLLTVFTCLISKSTPLKIIKEIWDMFIINGWPVLISTCLALFSICQDKVLGENLENTIGVFFGYINCNNLLKEIYRFEVTQSYLDELERAFCLR
jgi:Rab-GTPase-TBC domain